MSRVRQFQMPPLSGASTRLYSDSGRVSRFLTLSCQLAVNSPSGSRPVTTRCTSAGARSATICAACSAEAAARNSWLIRAVPGQASISARRRSQEPRWRRLAVANCGSSRTIRLTQ